jgi:peptide/nickel transport system substrate-binding protein
LELARNDAWWGGKTPWEKVTLRILPNDATRVAALLSGDIQVIENVPTSDAAKLKTDKRLAIFRTVADRLIYVHMDSDRDVSPFVTDPDGKPLPKNPLKDPRVRKALSKAINRPVIVENVMEREAIPSGQLVADFLFGATKNLQVEKYDPDGAKKLLAEAGYPNGFGLTIHTPNNRYVNDARIAQAVAQMLSRVGVDTKVIAMPSATYFTQATDLKFSFMLLGWSTGTGEASSSLKALLMTYNRDKGFGTANRGRYSNGKVDAFTEDALQTVDDAKREAYLQRATELAINDTGIIPLHFQVNLWATRDGISYVPRVDEQTFSWKFRPAGASTLVSR